MKNNTNKKNYEKIREIATIGGSGMTKKKLCVVAWNGHSEKYDLRAWVIRPDSGENPKKGVTMTREELAALGEAIAKELEVGWKLN